MKKIRPLAPALEILKKKEIIQFLINESRINTNSYPFLLPDCLLKVKKKTCNVKKSIRTLSSLHFSLAYVSLLIILLFYFYYIIIITING